MFVGLLATFNASRIEVLLNEALGSVCCLGFTGSMLTSWACARTLMTLVREVSPRSAMFFLVVYPCVTMACTSKH